MATKQKLEPLKSPEITQTREKRHNLSFSDVVNYFKTQKNFHAADLSHYEKIEDPRTETMSVSVVNGKYVLKYNPTWFQYLDKDEVATVIAHEVGHINCRHIPRFAMIEDQIVDETEKLRYRMIYNAAADLAINSLLKDSDHYKLPNSGLTPEFYGLPVLKSMEYYAAELADKVKIVEVEVEVEIDDPNAKEGEGSEGQSADAGTQSGGGSGNAPGADGSSGGGNGQSTKPKIKVKQKQKKASSGNEALDGLLNQHHDWNVKDPNSNQSTRDICNRLDNQAKEAYKDAYAETGKLPGGHGCGDMPGSMLDHITEEIRAVGTSTWKRLVHRYVRDTKEKSAEFRINKIKRTRWSLDGELGLYGAETENPKFNIDFGIDTSGSMSSETLKEILEFAQAILSMDDELRIRITEYDHTIQKQYILNKSGEVDSELLGRGGTDFNQFFRSVCESLDERKLGAFKSDIVFNCTDGEASPPCEEYRFNTKETPLVWVLMQGGVSPCPEYGETVSM